MLRLGDAIRLGAMLRPQAFANISVDGKSCAVGAALEAAGVKLEEGMQSYHLIKEIWPWTEADNVHEGIWKMNDARFTREQVADWVDTIDPTPRETEQNEETDRSRQVQVAVA